MQNTPIEILFISNSSLDRRGKRVMVRKGGVENVLWPGELQAADLGLLGLSRAQQKEIARFLAEAGSI